MSDDVWGWTYAKDDELRERGLDDLADYMEALPGNVHGSNYAYLDSTYEWAIGEARANGEAWVEIFIRHWRLQDWVFSRGKMIEGQPEAASLLEFATRPENRDCPQSVCAIQDFCRASGSREGPAYASARIEIIEDCFRELDPESSCYECLTIELTEACRDEENMDRLEAFLHKTGRHIQQGMDPESLDWVYPNAKAEIAISRGAYGEALDWLKKIEQNSQWSKECWEDIVQMRSALCYARLGDAATAVKQLGDTREFITDAAGLADGCDAALAILDVPELDAKTATGLARFLSDGVSTLVERGMSYEAIRIACLATAPVAAHLDAATAAAMLAVAGPEMDRLKEPQRLEASLSEASRHLA